MQFSDEQLEELKELLEEKYEREVSDEEVLDSAQDIMTLAEIAVDHQQTQLKRERKLKEQPNGFHIKGKGYTCAICRDSISDEETWYDQWGIKCLTCQAAIDDRTVPGIVAKDESSWYSKFELKRRFNIGTQRMKKLIRDDVLTPRIIKNENDKPHVYVFLVNENRGTLPPKDVTEHRSITFEKEDGNEWHRSESWYKFVNPEEKLKNYKIVEYMKIPQENHQ